MISKKQKFLNWSLIPLLCLLYQATALSQSKGQRLKNRSNYLCDINGDGHTSAWELSHCVQLLPVRPSNKCYDGIEGGPDGPVTFVVNSTDDVVDETPGDSFCATSVGSCTLRAAVMEANAMEGTQVIFIPSGTYYLTLPLRGSDEHGEDFDSRGDLDIRDHVVFCGQDAQDTIIDARHAFGIMDIWDGVNVSIFNLTLKKGSGVRSYDIPGGGVGLGGAGAINAGSTGHLIIDSSILSRNIGESAGAIASGGGSRDTTVEIRNSTIKNNSTYDRDSGQAINKISGNLVISNSSIYNNGTRPFVIDSSLDITNSTIEGSYECPYDYGVTPPTLRVRNSLFVLGFPCVPRRSAGIATLPGEVKNSINLLTGVYDERLDSATTDHNVNERLYIGVGSFVDNPRPGKSYYPLVSGSSTIDAGIPSECPPEDQLGRTRVGTCDIGPIEYVDR